jgi:hypothetical protein
MRTNTPLPTNTPASSPCACDCDGDGQVSIGDLVRSVPVALGDLQLADCSGLGAGTPTIQDLIRGVRNALDGCS